MKLTGVVEQLLISNEDLSRECRSLKKKLSDTTNAVVKVGETIESIRAEKLRATENCNNLACELARSQVKDFYLVFYMIHSQLFLSR